MSHDGFYDHWDECWDEFGWEVSSPCPECAGDGCAECNRNGALTEDDEDS